MKINIIGASGTGKTTLGKAIAEKFGCAHFDSDDYYHYPTDPPFQKQRSPEERVELLMTDLNKNFSWVLAGGAAVWDPAPAVKYSMVVFLYLPPAVRLERLRQRELDLYGSRIGAGGDMEKDHIEFMKRTAGYDDGSSEGTNTLPCHLKFINSLTCPVVKFEEPFLIKFQIESVAKVLQGFL